MSSGIGAYLVFMLIGAGVAGLINKRKGRTVVMPFTAGAITLGVLWVAEIIFGIVMINVRNIEPYRATYMMLDVLFDGGVALVLSIIVAVFDRKRRLAEIPPPPTQ